MKNKNIYSILLFAIITLSKLSFGQVIYMHAFGTTTFTAVNPYTVTPTTIDANLSGSQWATSYTNGFSSLAGVGGAGSQALSLSNSGGTPTYSLSYIVGPGFNCDITAFSFWRQRSTAGAQNWTLTVNGVTTIGTGTVPTTGITTGSLGVSSPANGLSGVVNVVLQLSGATSTGTFRLDDFTLYGSVYPASTCTPPTTQASLFTTALITNTSANVSWTAGNGGNVIVVAHQTSAISAFPASGTVYTANSFFGSGQNLGGNNYVVYNGTGNSFNLTGLFAGSTYHFAIMEYNTTSGTCYLFPALTNSLVTTGTLGNCLDIESILVDACVPGGNCDLASGFPACDCEGKNEMVRFKVGPAPINVSDLNINWPSNAYLGIETNTTITTPLVNALNSGITACGYLKQPTSGILPAGKQVLLMTSTDFCTTANSFANLNDTLILIFQVAGNTGGHFGNTTNGGAVSSTPTGSVSIRTLSINQISTSCTESVSYDRSLLVNIFGTYNGNTSQNDGSTVEYDAPGNATYINRGCVAPFIPFSIEAGAANASVCFNSSSVLTATTSNVFTSILWSGGAGTFSTPSALTTSYTPGVGETGTIKLYVTMTQSCSSTLGTTKDSVLLTILQLPLATLSTSNSYSLCPSATSVMSYTVTNPTFADVVTPGWSSPSGSGATYTVSSPSGTASVTYSLNLTNVCGTTLNTFTVYPLALPTVTLSATTPTACVGGTVSLTATGNTTNFSWTNPVSTNSTVTLTANTTTTGIVTSTNSCGPISATYTLTVTQNPVLTVDNPSPTLCAGQLAIITATSSTGTYTWMPGSINTNSIVVNSAGTHTVFTSNVCKSDSVVVNVTFNATPTLTISTTSNSLCAGGQITAVLSLGGSVGNYTWSAVPTNTSSISISTPGVYSATVDAGTCGIASASITIDELITPTISVASTSTLLCNGATATLTASSNLTNFNWSNGATNTPTIAVTAASLYTVSVSNACGIPSASVNILADVTPTLNLVSNTPTLCPSQSATLTVTGGIQPYTWSNSASTGSVVTTNGGTVSVSSSNACGIDTETISVSIIPNPTVTLASSSTLLCDGVTATITASSNMTNEIWSDGSTNTNSIFVNTAGIYTVGVSNACGSPTASINIQTNTTPTLNLTASSTTLCPNQSATLTVTGGSSPYVWSNSSSTGSVVTTTGGTVTVSNTNGCGTASQSINITVVNINASISANPTSGITPVVVDFTNNSIGATTYAWNFGNGLSANTQTVSSQTYSVVGTHTVYLLVTNGTCSDIDSLTIRVLNEEPTLIIPNVFTPNGDSVNDVFRVTGFNIIEFNCTIFDRWGIQMYYWDTIKNGWDGKTDGKAVPDGTYFYIINAKDIDNKEIKRQGHISLFQ